MKIVKIVFFIIFTIPHGVYSFDIIPNWNENDEFIYHIEVTDERPPHNNKRWITQSNFKASLKIMDKTNESYILEWKYLPVKNPIPKCPLPDKDLCYSWTNDIKQSLKLIFNASIEGAYESVTNPKEVVDQIGKIFEAYISKRDQYKNLDKETIRRLKESVINDDSIVSELLEYHLIYGSSVSNGKFDKSSRYTQFADQSKAKHSSKIYEKNDLLIVEFNMVVNSFPNNDNGHLIEGKYNHRWVFNKHNLTIIELDKKVDLKTKEGTRKFGLTFRQII